MTTPPRDRRARDAAERALVRLVAEYGGVPNFVLLGGLVPDLLCSEAPHQHVGTTDVDLQVNLEITSAGANAARLEEALRATGFTPDSENVWRWRDTRDPTALVKVEFLADLDDVRNEASVRFDDCAALGALNLRGTRFAESDSTERDLRAQIEDEQTVVRVRVAGLAGYLLAKVHAYYGRRLPKDLYDITFVLLHNDAGGPRAAAQAVLARFAANLGATTVMALDELAANFRDAEHQGPAAYVDAMLGQHPDLDGDVLANDAVLAVAQFVAALRAPPR